MNSSLWRLEEVDGGAEQYPVESRFVVHHTPPPCFDRSTPTQVRFVRFAVRHTPLDRQDPRFDRRRSVSSILRYTTPLPINRTPRFDCRRSVSSILRYATPLPINRTPVSTVGGPFRPFCGTPDPSRSTGPPFRTWPVEHKAVSSVLRYARPRFHCMFRPSPPNEHNHAFRFDPAGWLPRVPLPPDEHDAFRCLPMNTTHSVASPQT